MVKNFKFRRLNLRFSIQKFSFYEFLSLKRITYWTYDYTKDFRDAIKSCDENKVFQLFKTQSKWKDHLKGLKFKESEDNGVLRVVSYPLLDLIENYPKVAEYVFSKLMIIHINEKERGREQAQRLCGKLG